ncbi:unnamed protein product [Rhizopus stolonifer]
MTNNMLREELKNYKLSVVKEGSSRFFPMHRADDWNFQKYYEETHQNMNRSKWFHSIVKGYCYDLNWIVQLNEFSAVVRDYASILTEEKRPAKAEAKASLAKNAVKKRKKSSKQNITIIGGNNIVGYKITIEDSIRCTCSS